MHVQSPPSAISHLRSDNFHTKHYCRISLRSLHSSVVSLIVLEVGNCSRVQLLRTACWRMASAFCGVPLHSYLLLDRDIQHVYHFYIAEWV